ncbi:U3 snoRNP protein [Arachnomyces sp. PD_36]|nr:U3 snoRNP protein [Arachnomyces sp. PD_36]
MSPLHSNSPDERASDSGIALPSLHNLLNDQPGSQPFLQPTYPLYTASVVAAKQYLDPLAWAVHKERIASRERRGKKRKRSDSYRGSSGHGFQLRELHVDGFTVGQIWEQAKRVLESSETGVEWNIARILENDGEVAESGHSWDEENQSQDDSPQNSDPGDDQVDGAYEESLDLGKAGSDLRGTGMPVDVDGGSREGTADMEDGTPAHRDPEILVRDRFGLNDGFFSIDEFNRQSEMLENQDARGSPDADAASDEEDVYWDVDPLASSGLAGSAGQMKTKHGGSAPNDRPLDEDSADDEDDDDGPTFGDADLDAASEPDEDESSSAEPEGDDSWDNANGIKYSDFFAPPAVKDSRKRQSEHSSTPHDAMARTQDIQGDIEIAMSDVRRDLLDSDVSDEEAADNSGDEPKSRQSTHEKIRAKLADEIRRLESANVSKRDWTLSGEAKAPQRPLNSLIEEDLEFERVGKPVPVVTNEVTEEIEQLIKRRIIAKEFDEVPRRHPDSLSSRANPRREKYQLDDSKPQQSLAELYETDHLRATDPSYVEPKDAKLKQEHLEISELWKGINSQLDTLSNWHYKPKTPHANISVVSDVATISMEDARPTAGQGVDGPGMLAPQEVYQPGNEGKSKGALTFKSGSTVAKQEMSREEKLRQRKREKQKTRKRLGNSSRAGASEKRDQLVSTLDKAGVKVIGKDGDAKDVYGQRVKSSSQSKRGDELKL